MTDTPRTDEATWRDVGEVVDADFARTLERELTEWHHIAAEQVTRLTAERDRLQIELATALQNVQVALDLRAEIERMRALLMEYMKGAQP